jgi:hypothetical protein
MSPGVVVWLGELLQECHCRSPTGNGQSTVTQSHNVTKCKSNADGKAGRPVLQLPAAVMTITDKLELCLNVERVATQSIASESSPPLDRRSQSTGLSGSVCSAADLLELLSQCHHID